MRKIHWKVEATPYHPRGNIEEAMEKLLDEGTDPSETSGDEELTKDLPTEAPQEGNTIEVFIKKAGSNVHKRTVTTSDTPLEELISIVQGVEKSECRTRFNIEHRGKTQNPKKTLKELHIG